MSIAFKAFGAVLVLLSAAFISKKYSEHITYKAALLSGFSELLLHIKNKITVCLAPPSELITGFSSKALFTSGFLGAAKELGSPSEAYRSVAKSIPLTPEARAILDSYFDSFGAAYKDELVRATEAAESALRHEAQKAAEALPREKKLSRTVIFAVALGVIILFI